MRDRYDLCVKCGDGFRDTPRDPHNEDRCWWCGVAALDEPTMIAMAEYFAGQPTTREYAR